MRRRTHEFGKTEVYQNPYAGIIRIRCRVYNPWVSSQPELMLKHPIHWQRYHY